MRLSQKSKKRWLWVFGTVGVVLALVLIWRLSWTGAPDIIPPRSVATYTKEQLADLYWEHKDEFNKVAEIVLASDAFRQRIIDNNDDDWGIRSEYLKDDFPEEGWGEIVDLFKVIRPYMIMRSLREGRDVVYFSFASQKTSGLEISTSLYYFKSAGTMEKYKDYFWVGVLEHLDGYWYIGEHTMAR